MAKRSRTQQVIKVAAKKLPPPRWPAPNPDYEYSPPRVGRIWRDPCDHSKGSIAVVELDGGKCSELAIFHKVGKFDD